MQDIKNIFLAWFSTATGLLAAANDRLTLTIISIIVLPIVFFVIGKTVDVLLQIYLHRRK
ncbi:MAG: hypothetical protein KF881_09760 [Acidobacteria bacterium]|nr:hypothetical protein [Acidobacteriota bacterium]